MESTQLILTPRLTRFTHNCIYHHDEFYFFIFFFHGHCPTQRPYTRSEDLRP